MNKKAGEPELTTADRIILAAMKHRGKEGMTDAEIEAVGEWVRTAEIWQAYLGLAEKGLIVPVVRPDGQVGFRAVPLPEAFAAMGLRMEDYSSGQPG